MTSDDQPGWHFPVFANIPVQDVWLGHRVASLCYVRRVEHYISDDEELYITAAMEQRWRQRRALRHQDSSDWVIWQGACDGL